MKDIADKSDSTPGATGQLPAPEFNDHKNEHQNSVEKSGQTLDIAKITQQARAMFINGVGAQSCIDSGTANAIVLTPKTGSSGLVVPDAYSQFEGAIIEFDKTTKNTATAVTIDIGQTTGTLLGTKNLKKSDGTILDIGQLEGRIRVRYDSVGGEWLIVSISTNKIIGDITSINSNGTHTVYAFQKYSVVLLETGVTTLTINAGTGVNETTKLLIQNNTGVTVTLTTSVTISLADEQTILLFYNTDTSAFEVIVQDKAIIEHIDTTPTTTYRVYREKIIEIGDWNMNTTASVTVAHGLGADYKKIRPPLSVMIRDDADDFYIPIYGAEAAGHISGTAQIGDSTNVTLARITGGLFDNVGYQATSYNRGWIYILYEV